jgi:asparagine synthase (glutamine-hydrolysing)
MSRAETAIDSRLPPAAHSNQRKISIKGLPVYSGALLAQDAPVFGSLNTREDFIAFARRLRGQFSIVIEDGATTIALTDFGCSRPIFYIPENGGKSFRVASRLEDLVPLSNNEVSREALFFYVARGGVGIDPLYADIGELHPARVTWFRGTSVESVPYLDWGEFLETVPIEPGAAEERFLEIASGYLGAIAHGRGPISCLLSGGIDSALIAWLLRSIGGTSPALTADYRWKRYSEFDSASANARALGIPIERVEVTAASRRRAFRALNSGRHNAPCCHSQSQILFDLARYAKANGVLTLATGDHADSLFLGFDRFFAGFPPDTAGYARAAGALESSAKLDRLYRAPTIPPADESLLSPFGLSAAACLAWEQSISAGDRAAMATWAARAPLHVLQQLAGQIWAGISWQNAFLPVSQAYDDEVEFVSPFFDIEMIRFALSLPVEYKFRNGATKALLRAIASRVLGRSIPKRASPNPSRIWRLAPDLAERRAMPASLRPDYDRLVRTNLLQAGRWWSAIDQVAAFGLWIGQQPVGAALAE